MNKVILMGRLTKEPEIRYTQSQAMVTSFTLAVNRKFAKEGEERQTDFINIVCWSKVAEFVSKYYKKGQQVAIVGRLQVRNYEDDTGMKKFITEVIAEETYFADSKKSQDDMLSTLSYPVSVDTNLDECTSDDDLPF
ncbi:MAG: single-stranded DNA-binding protein [Clostridia bacterium]|nr:single-stranded DNA-binding protein [Clostridia bacterium]